MNQQKEKQQPETAESPPVATATEQPQKSSSREVLTITTAALWQGPYPPPSVLLNYPEEIQKEITQGVKEERRHRHKMERTGQANRHKSTFLSFALSIVAIIIAGITVVVVGEHKGFWALIILAFLPSISALSKRIGQWVLSLGKRSKKTENDNPPPQR